VIGADDGRPKAWLRLMRDLTRVASAGIISAGRAFVQNLRRGHYAITADLPVHDRSALRSTRLRWHSDQNHHATALTSGALGPDQRNKAG
jgi:hypothetical protein